VEVSEAEYLDRFPDQKLDFSDGPPGGETDWKKPISSLGAGCHPKRIKEFEKACEKRGIPTDFTTNRGLPIFKSRAHRKQVLRMLKLHDNQGGYSD
jgi:hypothetical protein